MENKQQESWDSEWARTKATQNLPLTLIFVAALVACFIMEFCGCERWEEQKKIREEELINDVFQVPMTHKSENRKIGLAEVNESKKK